MSTEQINNALRSTQLTAEWEESRQAIEGVSPEAQASALAEIIALRDEFLKVVEEIADPEEITVSVAIKYIELKSHWIMLNTLLNYQTFRRGECDPEQMLRASLASRLLQSIENLVDRKDLSTITKFLAEPINKN